MSAMTNYLEVGFQEDRRELERVHREIEAVIKVLRQCMVADQGSPKDRDGAPVKDNWPYEIKHQKHLQASAAYSQSTNAMILFSLVAAARQLGPRCPLVISCSNTLASLTDLSEVKPAWPRLLRETATLVEEANGSHVTCSGTFGFDDPFTLTWLLELARSPAFAQEARTPAFAEEARIAEALRARASARVRAAFQPGELVPGRHGWHDPHLLSWEATAEGTKSEALKKREKSGRSALDHAFPLLRYTHMFLSLKEHGEKGAQDLSLSGITRYMKQRLHEQLSASAIRDGGFDVSELVYALEALLLLDPGAVSASLLDRVSTVIRESQQQTPYWRAVKPFVALPTGLVLFPISVETAHSLLRCAAIIEERDHDEDFLSKNIALFGRYVDWLRSRRSSGTALGALKFEGWHSEHVHLHEGIHVWETSQVLLFLIDYAVMLQKHIASESLKAANLKKQRPWKPTQRRWHNDYWDERHRDIGEPLLGTPNSDSPFRIYNEIGRHFVSPRPAPMLAAPAPAVGNAAAPQPSSKMRAATTKRKFKTYYSMLLYGPPGTGKTTVAKEICKALACDLITVTPSDFISGGESEVEARAKMIFEVLEVQSDVIVLLDEIDRMILDRDSDAYGGQSDIFQFMTPSMLTKLNNLRDREQIVFIVATNYAERIDAAAKRRGRVDFLALLAPPDLEGRRQIFAKQVDKALSSKAKKDRGSFIKQIFPLLKHVVDNTRLKVYGELKQILDDASDNVDPDEYSNVDDYQAAFMEALENEAQRSGPAAITLRSYSPRFAEDTRERQEQGVADDVAATKAPYDEFLLLLYLTLEHGGVLDEADRGFAENILRQLVGEDREKWEAKSRSEKRELLTEPIRKVVRGDKKLGDKLLDLLYHEACR